MYNANSDDLNKPIFKIKKSYFFAYFFTNGNVRYILETVLCSP